MTENLKEKLKSRQVTIGSWITIGSNSVAEIMAQASFEWLVIDMEHSAITLDIAQDMIRVIDLCGVPPLVRVGHNQPNIIKRVMDSGAHGVIVPMVNSKTEAEQAVASVKYPPEGFRGVGLARAQEYGQKFEKYREWNQENSVVIVQIEHIEAVNNLEDILNVPGVDGFIVGPYDLSASLGVPGQFEQPTVTEAQQRIMDISCQYNVLRGFHVVSPDPQAFIKKVDEGYNFLAYSLDSLILANSCRNMLQYVNELLHG